MLEKLEKRKEKLHLYLFYFFFFLFFKYLVVNNNKKPSLNKLTRVEFNFL